jgi:hypothetical protein
MMLSHQPPAVPRVVLCGHLFVYLLAITNNGFVRYTCVHNYEQLPSRNTAPISIPEM